MALEEVGGAQRRRVEASRNMKGRLYDPALRRFTTADPHVTEPLNPQGLNRYAYVQNNPMNFTDPSGFDCYDSLSSCGQAQAASGRRGPCRAAD